MQTNKYLGAPSCNSFFDQNYNHDFEAPKMLGIDRPHFTLRVEQTESTFAEGNARW